MKETKIFNVRITIEKLNDILVSLLDDKKKIIYTPNPEILLYASENPHYRDILNNADILLPDGHGLLLVSTILKIKNKFLRFVLFFPYYLFFLFYKKIFKNVIPDIIHGSDFMDVLVSWSELNNKPVFFLGSINDNAKKTAEYFKDTHPNLIVAGYSNADPDDIAFDLVTKSGAKILFVAYGAPKQEIFINKYIKLRSTVEIAMAVGGSFDFYSGNIERAPSLFRAVGLEWFYRLIIEPKKRAIRIYNATIKFPIKAIFFSR